MIPRRSSADSSPGLRSEARRSSVARSMYPWIDAIFDSFDLTTPTATEVIVAPFAVPCCSLGRSANSDAESKMKIGEKSRLDFGCCARSRWSRRLRDRRYLGVTRVARSRREDGPLRADQDDINDMPRLRPLRFRPAVSQDDRVTPVSPLTRPARRRPRNAGGDSGPRLVASL